MVKQSLHLKRAAVSLAAIAAFGASGVVSAQVWIVLNRSSIPTM